MTLSGVDSADAFDRILDSVRQLPSPPMICMAVAEATQSDLTTLSLLQRLIESDIALSGRVVQVANSAFFGIAETVTSVRRAITLLGFATVRRLALAFFYNEEFGRIELPGLPYPQLPQYALASSVLAETIAELIEPEFTADYATLGLLHESGVIVMAMAFGSQYRQFLQSFQGSQQPFWQGESETFGINHALAGQLLLSRWKLPAPFTHAVAAHHDPELAEVADPLARRFWRVLTLAHTGALLFLGQCQADVFVLASELARRHLNWTAQRLGEVLEMAEPICRERTIMLGTPTDQAASTLTCGGWTGKIRAASAACK